MKHTSSDDNLRSCGEAECPVPQALHGVFGLVGRGWRPRSNPVGGTILRAAVAHGRTTAAACPGAAGRFRTEPPQGAGPPSPAGAPSPRECLLGSWLRPTCQESSRALQDGGNPVRWHCAPIPSPPSRGDRSDTGRNSESSGVRYPDRTEHTMVAGRVPFPAPRQIGSQPAEK